MKISARLRRLTAWITCFAILLSLLAPSVSHAILAQKGTSSSFLEICTSAGTQLIKAGAEQTLDQGQDAAGSASNKKMDHAGHCPFCDTSAGSFGALPSQSFIFPVVAGTYEMPALFYRPSRPLFAWASAQPRAPPVAS